MDLAVGGADHAVSRAAKLDFALRGFVKFEACLRPVFKNYEGVLSDLKSPSPSRNAVIEGAGDDRIHCDLVTFAFDVIVLLENGTLRPNLLSFFSIKGMVCSFFGKFDDVIVRVALTGPDAGGAASSADCALRGVWGNVRYGSSETLGVKGVGKLTEGSWPPSADNSVSMHWTTTFESGAGGAAGHLDEASDICLGVKAPPKMVEQLLMGAGGPPGRAIGTAAPDASKRATRSGKDAAHTGHVLVQGVGENRMGRFAVLGIFNTATHECVFWKKYHELADGGAAAGGSAAFPPAAGQATTPVLPRARAAATPGGPAGRPTASTPAASGAGALLRKVSGGSASSGSAALSEGAAVATGSRLAGEKRVRTAGHADPDPVRAELAAAQSMALAQPAAGRKEALAAKLAQAQQLTAAIRKAREDLTVADVDVKGAADALIRGRLDAAAAMEAAAAAAEEAAVATGRQQFLQTCLTLAQQARLEASRRVLGLIA